MATRKYKSKYAGLTESEKQEIRQTYMKNYYKIYNQMHKEETQRKYRSEHTGQIGAGRPLQYTPEEAHERIKASKREYARNKAEERRIMLISI